MRKCVYIPVLLLLLHAAAAQRARVLFDHRTYEQFSKGNFSDAGANLYVSQKGRLQFIHLFDLNFDCYPEVVLNNDHNHMEAPDALVYHNADAQGLRSLYPPFPMDAPEYQNLSWIQQSLSSITRLQAEGAGKSVIADLNGDGFKDLVFVNFIHGSTLAPMPAYIYWGTQNGFDENKRSLLDGDRSTSVAADDVNGDGLTDIVLANAGREHMGMETPEFSAEALAKIAGHREKTSYLFLQTEAGFTNSQRINLQTSFAIDVKIADLDRDGKKEIIFLELGSPGAIRILEQKSGEWKTVQTFPVIAPKPLSTGKRIYEELLVKDLNGDGYDDIFAPSSGNQSEIFWSGKGKFDQTRKTVIESENAMGAAAADLNKDGFTDLVIANHYTSGPGGKPIFETNSYIWWGNAGGFKKENRKALPTLGAVSVRLADINNTGNTDILFAQHRNQLTLDVPNYIYLNTQGEFYPERRLDLHGFGTVNLAVADLDGNKRPEVVVLNSMSGKAYHSGYDDGAGNDSVGSIAQPMYIYKGNAHKSYGPANLVRLPQSMAESNNSFADLDDDGASDLVHLRGSGYRITIRYNVYEYPVSKEMVEINVPFRANTVNVADFNSDGILDILATPIVGPQAMLCFGTGNRRYTTSLFDFPHYAYCANTGDVNNDGLLDVVTSSHREICILKGAKTGKRFYFLQPEIVSTEMLTTRVSMADFNKDGWPDIVAQNLQNTNTKFYDVDSWVLINKLGSFSIDNKISFPTYGANGGTIARLYNDSNLQVVASNYHAEASRRVGLFIYNADASGFPDNKTRQRLPAYSSGANLVLDFNADGYQDILVCNHTGNDTYNGGLNPTGGTHGVGSVIYWGRKEGFNITDKTDIPSFGPHSRIAADPGSVGSRNPFEIYTSANITNNTAEEDFILTVDGRFNNKQFVEAELTAEGPLKPATLISKNEQAIVYLVKVPTGKSFRYRLKLHSSNTGSGPLVSAVSMKSYQPSK